MKSALRRAAALMICLMLGLCGLGLAEQPMEFVEVPEGTQICGVTVGEPLRMGVALARAARSIALQFSAADFDILGAYELLSPAEYGALKALDPVEQALAVLIMAGCSQESFDAVAQLGLSISSEARALVAAVYQRYTEMSASERSASGAVIARYFSSDGGARVTLRIGEQLIRFSFRQEAEGMVLNGVSISQ